MLMSSTKKYARDMAKASCYEEWKQAAVGYDSESGHDRWKRMDQSRRYDYVSIRMRLDRLRGFRARHDNAGLLFNLNEGIHGNMGGMGSPALYRKTQFGTKQLIVDYVDEIVDALEHLGSAEVDDISFEDKLDFFRRAHHCFGQSALMMSGAGSLLYFHVGVVKALWEQDLLPLILSGSSGGAFVSALLCTHSEKELEHFFDPENLVYEIKRDAGLFDRLAQFTPQVMQIDEIREVLDRLIPDLTFEESFERTGRHLNISIAPAETHQTSRLLNSITSPNVFIREACMASGAIPGVYPPVTLAAKNNLGERQAYLPSRKWVDGSVSDDLPAKRLARLYGVNHYIVSQTNPHVIPFVTDAKRAQDPVSVLSFAAKRTAREWMNASAAVMRRPLALSPTLSKFTNTAMSIINQDYVGDVNILPEARFYNPFRLLAHRTVSEIMDLISAGERATWPKIEMIRIQTRISRTLERKLAEYETQYVKQAEGRRRKAG